MSLYDTRAIDKVKVVMMKGETGGGGGGASALTELSDVNISSPTNGQVLKYNSTTQEWVNSTDSGLPENPLAIAHGGTGNAYGYIRTGAASGTTIGTAATAEGYDTTASGEYSHAEGIECVAEGDSSHAEGSYCAAEGWMSHAEGSSNIASGIASHAEGGYFNSGDNNTASGDSAHAEGAKTTASGDMSHAEGYNTTASGGDAHAEGSGTTASFAHAHAEGYNTTASGNSSHAGGTTSVASGLHSFAHGQYVTAGYAQQSVLGRYNDNKSTSLFEIGNGADANNRSNALEVDASGNVVAGGNITDGQGNKLSEAIQWDAAKTSVKKNLLKNTATTQTKNNTTFTVNDDKSISVNTGTGGASGEINFTLGQFYLPQGTYFLSGCPAGGGNSTYRLLIFINFKDGTTSTAWRDLGDGASVTIDKEVDYCMARLDVLVNTEISDKTFYPMIRDASIADDTYVPFIYDNVELASSKTDTSVVGPVESGTTASQAYAVGEHFIRGGKFCTAIAAIASGATLTQGTNYVEGTIAEALIRQNTYSTDEIMIGEWFGQPLYRRCWEVRSMPNATEMTIQTGLTGLYVRFCYGCMHHISFCSNLPYVSKDNVANNVSIYTRFETSLNIIIKSGNNQSANSGVIVFEYTKNSENP